MVPPGRRPRIASIEKYFRPIATHPGAFDLSDDAAAITPPPGCDLVLKTDGVIGGVHFFPEDPPDAVARKALRINLSDLAAKGAAPLGFLLAIGLPAGLPPDWLAAFAHGLRQDAEHYGCPLLGGDTDRSPSAITVYISALGTVPHGTMVRRKGARPGRLRGRDRHYWRRRARARAAAAGAPRTAR